MSVNIIYKDEYLGITEKNGEIYVETFKKGYPLGNLASLLAQHTEIELASINTLRRSIMTAPAGPEKIGELKERIKLDVSPDGLTATITFNVPADELSPSFVQKLEQEIMSLLIKKGIVYGVNLGFLRDGLVAGKPYIVANGAAAVNGVDSVIKMYELLESKPEIRDDGKADFFDMRLINHVDPGDWLGERIEAIEGKSGKTVRGEEIKPVKGKTFALNYNRNSVKEVAEGGKTVLYSRLCGAVNYTNGKIGVSNHLEIDGDVGVITGNIKFDGCLTIKGTILDGFSVEATDDIEINSQYGLGNIKGLVSTNGSIYIKGGISTKEKVEIRAAKNIYVKFADNVRIICNETVHIGYYSLNSDICASDVVFDSMNGQVIGGHIRANIHFLVPYCGSDMERRTTIEVKGFNRQSLVSRLDEVFREIGMKKKEQQKIKLQSSEMSGRGISSAALSDRLYKLREEIKSLEEERKRIAVYLKTKGDGEIAITRRLYPNCSIILGGMHAKAPPDVYAVTFYLKDGEIKQM